MVCVQKGKRLWLGGHQPTPRECHAVNVFLPRGVGRGSVEVFDRKHVVGPFRAPEGDLAAQADGLMRAAHEPVEQAASWPSSTALGVLLLTLFRGGPFRSLQNTPAGPQGALVWVAHSRVCLPPWEAHARAPFTFFCAPHVPSAALMCGPPIPHGLSSFCPPLSPLLSYRL